MQKRRWLIAICACLVLLAALAGYKFQQISAAIAFAESFPEPSETVEAERARLSPTVASVNTIGEVVAPQAIGLRNELEGRIATINLQSGTQVRQGDLLVQLDISEEQARLKAAEARANLARLDLQRVQKLLQNRTVSEERVDQARAEYDVAVANIAALRATIDKKTIRAPFDARVGLHDLEVGEFLQANSHLTNLVGVNDFTWVDFSLPLSYGRLDLDTPVIVNIAGSTETAVEGRVVALDTIVNTASRNLRYRAQLPQTEIPPNTLVNVKVITGMRDAVQIPPTAVLHDDMGDYVYELEVDPGNSGANPAYRARRRNVETGAEIDRYVIIKSGLDADTLIATQGAFKLRSGLLVYIGERPTDES